MEEFLPIYTKELYENVLPFWEKHSLDREYGGYLTCLDKVGNCYDDRKYVWLQGRQAWLFAKLYNCVESKQSWREIATSGMKFLRQYARRDDGRVYFCLTREGKPFSMQRKIFSECFYLLAIAEFYKMTRESACRQEAQHLFSTIENLIENPGLLGRPVLNGQPPEINTLAIPMIMLGLLDEMTGVLAPEAVETKSRYYCEQLITHYDSQRRVFKEYHSPDKRLEKWPEGRLVNPGHSIEGAWFLLHYGIKTSRPELIEKACDVLLGSLELGWDKEYGGLYYFVDSHQLPLIQLEASMKLWWPHAEALYALTAAWCETGRKEFEVWHRRIHDYIYEHFVDATHGEWFGYCDREGRVTHWAKGGPYKGCFHVPRSLLFTIQALKKNQLSKLTVS